MHLPKLTDNSAIHAVTRALKGTGASVYVVGGAIRDALLDRPITDIDMVIAGLPLPEVEELLSKIGTVNVIGRRFAVIRVTRDDGSRIDIALPRTDDSFGTGRYRDVEVRADPNLPIEEDLARRDFTINAMAWDIASHSLIDPYGGHDDVRHGILRSVGTAADRFQEDATRIIRAARFAAQLNFSIEPTTLAGIRLKRALLIDEFVTAREVVADELIKGFTASPARMLDILDETGIIETLMPEIASMHGCEQSPEFHAEGDVWTHTRRALEALADQSFTKQFHAAPSPMLIIATLLHDVGKPSTAQRDPASGTIRFENHTPTGARIAEQFCTRLKLASTGVIDVPSVIWCIEHHHDIMNLDMMRPSTIERIFLSPDGRGELLQQLSWADARASLRPEEVRHKKLFHELDGFVQLQQHLTAIRKHGYHDNAPTTLLTGTEIMNELGLTPGKQVGDLIEALRDAQLSGTVRTQAEAIDFIHTHAT